MRKTIALTHPRHAPERALDLVKNTLRKYLKRERGKELPEGSDFWDFDCRMGLDESHVDDVHVSALNSTLDTFAAQGATEVYVEILARPMKRLVKETAAETKAPKSERPKKPRAPKADPAQEAAKPKKAKAPKSDPNKGKRKPKSTRG